MKFGNFIGFGVVAFCLVHGYNAEETLVDTFNDIYDSCLVHLSVDCVQPKAYEWFSKAIEKREIHLTEDLTIVKNDTAVANSDTENVREDGSSARDNQVNVISQVDDFLSTHYLNIRYPKAVINSHVPAFAVSTLNRFIPDAVRVPFEESNVNEGKFKSFCI